MSPSEWEISVNSETDEGVIMESFKDFATKRMIIGVVLAVALLWLVATIIGLLSKPATTPVASLPHERSSVQTPAMPRTAAVHPDAAETAKTASGFVPPPAPGTAVHPQIVPSVPSKDSNRMLPHAVLQEPEKTGSTSANGTVTVATAPVKKKTGVAFVTELVKPLDYELHGRFWGWRPNDILNFTDDVNNFQLGVLEVTRRTVTILTEKLSRTGSVESLDKNLERAMDWLMTKPDRYWFPSPESRYDDALSEINIYKSKLEKNEAAFYTRADNLLPLLASYDNLLGSCDENLIKTHEPDGKPVSWFKVDDYFYYAQGVASSLETILKGVQEDFSLVLETRHGTEILRHAIEACHRASEIHPWVVTDAAYDGILANHRANLAAPISHARFYIDVLIAALST